MMKKMKKGRGIGFDGTCCSAAPDDDATEKLMALGYFPANAYYSSTIPNMDTAACSIGGGATETPYRSEAMNNAFQTLQVMLQFYCAAFISLITTQALSLRITTESPIFCACS